MGLTMLLQSVNMKSMCLIFILLWLFANSCINKLRSTGRICIFQSNILFSFCCVYFWWFEVFFNNQFSLFINYFWICIAGLAIKLFKKFRYLLYPHISNEPYRSWSPGRLREARGVITVLWSRWLFLQSIILHTTLHTLSRLHGEDFKHWCQDSKMLIAGIHLI